MSHESELQCPCSGFLMQEGKTDLFISCATRPCFSSASLAATSPCGYKLQRSPWLKATYRPSHSVPPSCRAMSAGLVLLLGNASAQCPFKQKSCSPQNCNLKRHSGMFCAYRWRGELVSACNAALSAVRPLTLSRAAVTSPVPSPVQFVNLCHLCSLSRPCLACSGTFETPVSPPALLPMALSSENQSQHDPQSLS